MHLVKRKIFYLNNIIVFTLLIIIGGCAAGKRIKNSSKLPVIIVDSTQRKRELDSLASLHSMDEVIYNKVAANKINCITYTAKMKVDIENEMGRQQGITANVRIQKDSVIWIDVTATLGIEVARALITKDSVIVIDRLKKIVYNRNFNYLQQLLHIPVNFTIMQNLLLGNPVYFNDSLTDIITTPSVISFTIYNDSVINKMDVFANNYLLQHCHLTQTDSSSKRSLDITYGGYGLVDNRKFPSRRNIFVTGNHATQIDITVTRADFDKPVNFPFNIPNSYEEK